MWFVTILFRQAGAYVLMAMNRIRQMHAQPAPISVSQMSNNPYVVKLLRKAIDGGAFKIYGHWVKRSENQNRAALFEIDIKRDIKLSTSRWCFVWIPLYQSPLYASSHPISCSTNNVLVTKLCVALGIHN